MKDLIVIAIVLGFFAACAAYVTWCDHILASDAPDRAPQHAQDVGRAASTAETGAERTADSAESEADRARVL